LALGGAEVAAAFAALPFDHIMFTGSTSVGRKIMAAAAPNLTPVTLELGGKAPAVVAPDFPLALAAARIASGKWFNAGQTCIGVDYARVDAPRRDAFVEALRAQVRERFGDLSDASHYTRIINAGQFDRLQGYLADARARGCMVLPLVDIDAARMRTERLLPPTLVLDPPDDSDVMRHEIFGPILPVRTYGALDDALRYIGTHDRPLALYPFSNDRATVERIIDATLAGGVAVNDTLVHFAVHGLPFGGIGPSGMGAIHGKAGFDAFSKLLPVFRQSRWAATDLLRPPYAGFVDRLVRFLSR
jgi:coniferyl-aldehyde dehydrogenase